MKNYFLKQKNYILLGIYCILFSYFTYNIIISFNYTKGLDPSYIWIINEALSKGWIYGKDLFITFGPLGFIMAPMEIGSNIIIAKVFFSVIFLYSIYVIFNLLCLTKKYGKFEKIALSLLLLIIASDFMNNSRDYYIMFVFLLSLSLTWFTEERKKRVFNYIIALLFVNVVSYIKFSGSISMIITIIMFLILYAVEKKEKIKDLIVMSLASLILFALSFYIYSGSTRYLFNYMKYALEISSGYNLAMSLTANSKFYILVIALVFLYLLFCIIKIHNNRKNIILLLFLVPAFFLYKHGFVRSDDHIFIFFKGLLLCISVILINLQILEDRVRDNRLISDFIIATIIILCLIPLNLNLNFLYEISVYRWNQYKAASQHQEYMLEESSVLSKEFLDKIKDNLVTIYGFEMSYAYHNRLNFKPMPSIQAYTMYTPELDEANSKMLDIDKPQYIIFSDEVIDGRLPFVEAPRTFNKILKDYRAIVYDSSKNLVLLERMHNEENRVMLDEIRGEAEFDEIIELPNLEYDYIKLSVQESLFGKLSKLAYKIPDVYLEAFDVNNNIIYMGRILPEMLNIKEGISLNIDWHNLFNVSKYINEDKRNHLITKIRFTGPGKQFYQNKIYYSFIVSSRNISTHVELEHLYSQKPDNPNVNLKYYISDKNPEVCIDNMRIEGKQLFITGWSLDGINRNVPPRTYIKIGDLIFKTNQLNREDLVNHFGLIPQQSADFGYYAYIPLDKINLDSTMEIIVISNEDNTGNQIVFQKIKDMIR